MARPRKHTKSRASKATMDAIRALNEARPGSRSYRMAKEREAKRAAEKAKEERKKVLPKGGHPYDEAIRRLQKATEAARHVPLSLSMQKAELLHALRHHYYKLPNDDPHRQELGLTINPFRAIRAIEKRMSRSERRDYGSMVRRVKEWEEQIKEMKQEGS